MKKILFSLSLGLILVGGFVLLNSRPVSADTIIPGCEAGFNFSSKTGDSCHPSTHLVDGCVAGALYSSTTGERCNPTTVYPTDIYPTPPSCVNLPVNLSERLGSTGQDVLTLQAYLRSQASYAGENFTYGVFDYVTTGALSRYQRIVGIYPPSGAAGPITRLYIKNHTCISPTPAPHIHVLSPNGGEVWKGSPKVTDTISGFEQYKRDIIWDGAPDYPDTFSSNPSVKAYLETIINGQFVTLGRIPAFAYGSIAWVTGVVSSKDCDLNYPSDNTNNCFNPLNQEVVQPGQYYVRLEDSKTNTSDRSDAPFTITSSDTSENPFIRVLSPNAGEVLQTGNTFDIQWVSNGIASNENVKIELGYIQNDPTYPGGQSIENWIVEKTPNTGSYRWKIPEKYATGVKRNSFYIKLTSASGLTDRSDSTFTINPGPSNPTLTVTSPVSGATYSVGQTVPVNWTPFNAGPNGEAVGFTLLKRNDPSFARLALGNGYSAGWSFTVPSVPSGSDYYLKVETSDNAIFKDIGYSNSFSITSDSVSSTDPFISYVQSPAEDRNILHPGERATVYGSNLNAENINVRFSAGKIVSSRIATFNPHEGSIDFTVPDLDFSISNGNVDLYLEQSGRTSNKIQIKLVDQPNLRTLTFTQGPTQSSAKVGEKNVKLMDLSLNLSAGEFEITSLSFMDVVPGSRSKLTNIRLEKDSSLIPSSLAIHNNNPQTQYDLTTPLTIRAGSPVNIRVKGDILPSAPAGSLQFQFIGIGHANGAADGLTFPGLGTFANPINILNNPSNNQSPIINEVSAPTTLNVNQTGTWTVNATDPQQGQLTYSVNWGDNLSVTCGGSSGCVGSSNSTPFQQSASFTHSYSQAGTYTQTFTVRNSGGQSAQTTTTTKVGNITTTSPALQIITPNGGATYKNTDSIPVTWSYNYSPNQNPTRVILYNLATNAYDWQSNQIYPTSNPASATIPLDSAKVGQYKVGVCDNNKTDSTYGGTLCGWSGAFTITAPQVTTFPAPTALLTANGVHNPQVLTVNVGDTINYHWRSTNGALFNSVYSNTCSGAIGEWSANDNSGDTSGVIAASQAGCTYVITYSVVGVKGNAQDSVTIKVNPTMTTTTTTSQPPSIQTFPAPTASYLVKTESGSYSHDITVNQGDRITFKWSSTNGGNFTSHYTSRNNSTGASCGEDNWPTYGGSGTVDYVITSANANCTYYMNFHVAGVMGNADDSITVRVNPSVTPKNFIIPGPEPISPPIYETGGGAQAASILQAITNLVNSNANYMVGSVHDTLLNLFDRLKAFSSK